MHLQSADGCVKKRCRTRPPTHVITHTDSCQVRRKRCVPRAVTRNFAAVRRGDLLVAPFDAARLCSLGARGPRTNVRGNQTLLEDAVAELEYGNLRTTRITQMPVLPFSVRAMYGATNDTGSSIGAARTSLSTHRGGGTTTAARRRGAATQRFSPVRASLQPTTPGARPGTAVMRGGRVCAAVGQVL